MSPIIIATVESKSLIVGGNTVIYTYLFSLQTTPMQIGFFKSKAHYNFHKLVVINLKIKTFVLQYHIELPHLKSQLLEMAHIPLSLVFNRTS